MAMAGTGETSGCGTGDNFEKGGCRTRNKTVAGLLGLDFIPLRMERFDMIVLKERFFDQGIQLFLAFFVIRFSGRLH
jgi:hypothetical protein